MQIILRLIISLVTQYGSFRVALCLEYSYETVHTINV